MKRFSLFTIFFFLTTLFFTSPSWSARYYKVRYGDTLAKIAHRYGTSVRSLQRLNRLGRSIFIKTGRTLKVPGKAKPRTYRVRSGDTLAKIASRFGLRVLSLARWNKMKLSSVLRVGRYLHLRPPARGQKPSRSESHRWVDGEGDSKILLPTGFQKPTIQTRSFQHDNYTVKLFAHRFAVGHAVYLEVIPKKGKKLGQVKVKLGKKKVPVTKRPWGYRGLMAFSAYGKGGKASLSISQGNTKKDYLVKIAPTRYPLSVWRRYLGNYDRKRKPLTAKQKAAREKRKKARWALIKKSNQKKKKIFALFSPDRLQNKTAHPRGYHRVTSKFFTNRKIVKWYRKNSKKKYHKPRYYRHRGLDLAGRTGAPIYALADGKVVCAQRMYFEGNFTVVDHGQGVFSGYMHQSKMIAREGDTIKAGQLLGRVGTTGKVTGPHLHILLYVRGKPVQPLSLLGLPIR